MFTSPSAITCSPVVLAGNTTGSPSLVDDAGGGRDTPAIAPALRIRTQGFTYVRRHYHIYKRWFGFGVSFPRPVGFQASRVRPTRAQAPRARHTRTGDAHPGQHDLGAAPGPWGLRRPADTRRRAPTPPRRTNGGNRPSEPDPSPPPPAEARKEPPDDRPRPASPVFNDRRSSQLLDSSTPTPEYFRAARRVLPPRSPRPRPRNTFERPETTLRTRGTVGPRPWCAIPLRGPAPHRTQHHVPGRVRGGLPPPPRRGTSRSPRKGDLDPQRARPRSRRLRPRTERRPFDPPTRGTTADSTPTRKGHPEPPPCRSTGVQWVGGPTPGWGDVGREVRPPSPRAARVPDRAIAREIRHPRSAQGRGERPPPLPLSPGNKPTTPPRTCRSTGVQWSIRGPPFPVVFYRGFPSSRPAGGVETPP
ncbi:uncharacterized protein [Temnothorax nylanderi]|uniref:uncharacterized protein isoform X1 n=1 Tax=Temnothorax nylanderi TaxID=102681 RepID=UPI003A8395E7